MFEKDRDSSAEILSLQILQIMTKNMDVQALGTYRYTLHPYPNIQLNYKDAKNLFLGPLHKYQDAIAVILD